LLVSKQISKEALPSVYRTLRINGGAPLEMLHTLGGNIQHVRTLEVHFSCFCPWGSRAHQLNNETIYATIDPESTFSRGRLVSEWYPTAPVVKRYQDEWTEVFTRIQAQRGISDLAVTFLSCCRSTVSSSWITRFTRGQEGQGQQYQSCCLALEDHFLSLLANCRGTHKISLAGRAPPSLALRLASPQSPETVEGSSNSSTELIPTLSACGMTVKFVSKAMAAFIKATEEQRREWGHQVHVEMVDETEAPWTNTARFPPFEYDVTSPHAPHFVLVRDRTPRARWAELVHPESIVTGSEKDTQAVVDVLAARAWEDVAGYMDHDNDNVEVPDPEAEE
jgi:hypothetical protein